jgi:hypothetical protein
MPYLPFEVGKCDMLPPANLSSEISVGEPIPAAETEIYKGPRSHALASLLANGRLFINYLRISLWPTRNQCFIASHGGETALFWCAFHLQLAAASVVQNMDSPTRLNVNLETSRTLTALQFLILMWKIDAPAFTAYAYRGLMEKAQCRKRKRHHHRACFTAAPACSRVRRWPIPQEQSSN